MERSTEYMGPEGYQLVGAAFEVHRELGGGFSEEIYQESLEIELGLRSIPYASKAQLRIYYKQQLLNKTYIPDLVVSQEIVVELKAVTSLSREHERQLFNYLNITRKPVGYLINFGPMEKLEWKRFIRKEFLPKS